MTNVTCNVYIGDHNYIAIAFSNTSVFFLQDTAVIGNKDTYKTANTPTFKIGMSNPTGMLSLGQMPCAFTLERGVFMT